MSRNNERVLSDQMITDIREAMYTELRTDPESVWAVVDAMMSCYLTNDLESFSQFTTEIVEGYEDDVIKTLNMELMEDAYNQNCNND